MAAMKARPHSTSRRQGRHLPAFILLVLAEEPVHGAAVHDQLLKCIAGFKPDTGAVYRTLKTLEADGEVVSVWDTEGTGPARKVYRLTPAGWARLRAWRRDIEYRAEMLRQFLAACDELSWPDARATATPESAD